MALLCERSGTPLPEAPVRLDELIRRPQITYFMLAEVDENRPRLTPAVANRVEIEIKYEGYIKKQQEQAVKMGRFLAVDIQDIDFEKIKGLRIEAKEKLLKVNPKTIGQAMGISGVSPADISILMLEAAKRRRERKML